MLEFFNREKEYLFSIYHAKQTFTRKQRMKYGFILSESTIYKVLLSLFYIVSSIDFVPEKWITPIAFGFIDDLVVFIFMVSVVITEIHDMVDGIEYQKAESKNQEFIDIEKLEANYNDKKETSIDKEISNNHE